MSTQTEIPSKIPCLGIESSNLAEPMREMIKKDCAFQIEKSMADKHKKSKPGWFQLYDFISSMQ